MKNNILIVGGGSIGKRHLKNLIFLGQTEVTLVEPNKERSLAIEKEFNVKTYNTTKIAFENKKFEIAFICSPSVFHMDQALFCAEKGCDLFIEKPLSNNLNNVDKLLKIVEDKKITTMVGSNWKFYPLFQKMKELIDGGHIGNVLSARCQFGQYLPDWHPYEDHTKGYSANKKLGGGILLDSHEFDYLTWLLGDVEKLACFADRISDVTVDTEDIAEVILKFKNGAIGEIHLDYLQRFYKRNFEFFGENGTIFWDVNQKKVELSVVGKEKKEFALLENYDINDMYVEQTKHFLDCIVDRKQTICSVETGVKVLKLICSAKESSELHKFISID